MKSYVNTIKYFKSETVETIIAGLKLLYPDSEKSQIQSWETLINDIKNSNSISKLADDTVISIEFSLPTNNMAIDLILAGFDKNNKLRAYIIESKQWNDEYIKSRDFSVKREDGKDLHPQVQIYKHSLSFREYLDCGNKFDVSEFVFIRNCSSVGIEHLREHNPKNACKSIPIYNNIDTLIDNISNVIVSGSDEIKDILQNATFRPSLEIMNAMHSIITKEEPFILTSEQTEAMNKIKEGLENGKRIIRIKGSAGSGKTAILLNLYVEYLDKLFNEKIKTNKIIRPIFIPGNQNANMYGDLYPEVKNLFDVSYVIKKLPLKKYGDMHIIFMDEAQHNEEGLITFALDNGCKVVLCYDEKQRVSANDPIEELKELEKRDDFMTIELNDSVRFNGSKIAESNIRKYLNGDLNLEPDENFDFTIEDNFKSFQDRIIDCIEKHPNATVAVAGLLCGDAEKFIKTYNPDSILFTKWDKGPNWETPESQWMKYIYGKNYLNKNDKNIWVGTWWLPGLDVDYIFVIAGGDAKWTTNGIKGIPANAKLNKTLFSVVDKLNMPSELIVYRKDGKVNNPTSTKKILQYVDEQDDEFKEKFSKTYSEYIKNFYYILMTRGKKGCCAYFSNRE